MLLDLIAQIKGSQFSLVSYFTSTAYVVSWSEFLATDPEARVRFPALPKNSSGSGTGSTQPREYK
jgi:hypothetical protein